MEFTSKIKDIGRTLQGSLTITLESHEISPKKAAELAELGDLMVTIEKRKKKRSLDANAYYWLLVGKIGKHTGASKNHIHNMMLDRYGELDQMPEELERMLAAYGAKRHF